LRAGSFEVVEKNETSAGGVWERILCWWISPQGNDLTGDLEGGPFLKFPVRGKAGENGGLFLVKVFVFLKPTILVPVP
jgi:hypothetical protein